MYEQPRFCTNCRKKLTKRAQRQDPNVRFCSRKCANQWNGRKRVGTHLKRMHTVYTANIRKDLG